MTTDIDRAFNNESYQLNDAAALVSATLLLPYWGRLIKVFNSKFNSNTLILINNHTVEKNQINESHQLSDAAALVCYTDIAMLLIG